jgi:hypothetical protein
MVIQVIAILYCHIVYVWSYGLLLESLNGRSQIGNDNEPLTRKTRTQETLYPEKDEAISVRVAPATLFPKKDAHRCP